MLDNRSNHEPCQVIVPGWSLMVPSGLDGPRTFFQDWCCDLRRCNIVALHNRKTTVSQAYVESCCLPFLRRDVLRPIDAAL